MLTRCSSDTVSIFKRLVLCSMWTSSVCRIYKDESRILNAFIMTYANGRAAQPTIRCDAFHWWGDFPQEFELLVQVQDVLFDALEVMSFLFMRRDCVTETMSENFKFKPRNSRIGRYETHTFGHGTSACLACRL